MASTPLAPLNSTSKNTSRRNLLRSVALLEDWLKAEAKSAIKASLADVLPLINQPPVPLSIRDQKTRWGSCSAMRRLSFNWRLIMAPAASLHYVVVHEAAHLVHHNHSKQFWGLVEDMMPDFSIHKEWLNKHQLALFTGLDRRLLGLKPSPLELHPNERKMMIGVLLALLSGVALGGISSFAALSYQYGADPFSLIAFRGGGCGGDFNQPPPDDPQPDHNRARQPSSYNVNQPCPYDGWVRVDGCCGSHLPGACRCYSLSLPDHCPDRGKLSHQTSSFNTGYCRVWALLCLELSPASGQPQTSYLSALSVLVLRSWRL